MTSHIADDPLVEAINRYRRALDAYAVAVLDGADPRSLGRLALTIFRARRDLRRLGHKLPPLYVGHSRP